MREIKFRGKAVNTGEFVYGSPVQADGMAQILIPITNRQSHERAAGMNLEDRFFTHNNIDPNYIIEWDFISIIPETLGQYTDLKDCNGVEIYEGDELEDCDGIVIADMFDIRDEDTSKLAIVGNIHDNPELLESSK